MNSYIRKLQSKNEVARKQILLGSMVVCMSLVIGVWVYNLTDRFSSETVASKQEDNLQPFKLFANSISSTYDDISASVGKTSSKDATDETSQKQIDLIVVEPKENQ